VNLCRGVWAEAARYATYMRNYLVTAKSPISSSERFVGHKFDRIDTLHAFGEMAIVEDHPSHGDKILQFSPKLSLTLEFMIRRILFRRNEEKRSNNEQDKGN
jgi:hypothetical protein